jgi:aminopeptidase N
VTSAHAPKVRDFAFAAGPFREHTARTASGLTVRVWQGRDVTDAEADLALRTAVDSMTTFADWYGRYPYPEVDVVTGQFPYGSMEYPTLVTAVPDEVAVSHELAHQWWYALVGNNQYANPWLDESFTHYSALRFTGEQGVDCADPPWQGPDDRLTNGHDYWDQQPGGSYFVSVYLIGPCMLTDLETTLGSDRMLAMLKSYATAHRYGISTPAEFRDAAQAASPVDLTPLWDRWRVDF